MFQGNVEFFKEEDGNVSVNKSNSLSKTAQLLAVEEEELTQALTERVIAARGEIMQKSHTLQEAEYGRNALAKVIDYSRSQIHCRYLISAENRKLGLTLPYWKLLLL